MDSTGSPYNDMCFFMKRTRLRKKDTCCGAPLLIRSCVLKNFEVFEIKCYCAECRKEMIIKRRYKQRDFV